MRELKVVGLDVDGKHVLCEDDQQDKYKILVEDHLRTAPSAWDPYPAGEAVGAPA